MNITSSPGVIPEKLLLNELPRRKGVHLSGVLRALGEVAGVGWRVGKGKPPSATQQAADERKQRLRMALGLAWEWVAMQWAHRAAYEVNRAVSYRNVRKKLKPGQRRAAILHDNMLEFIHQPGEVKVQGVWANPDGVTRVCKSSTITPGKVVRVEEFKLTFRSAKDFDIRKEWRWINQVKGYCLAYEDCTSARFHVLHVGPGENSKSGWMGSMEYVVYDVEFTEKELDEMEVTIRKYREKAKAE